MLPPVFDFLNGPVRDLVTQIYESVGYLGVALWVAIESVIIPIPSELVLPFAGVPRRRGPGDRAADGPAVERDPRTLFGTVGATLGALVAYAIGMFGGRPVIERWAATSASPRRTSTAPTTSSPATATRPPSSDGWCR